MPHIRLEEPANEASRRFSNISGRKRLRCMSNSRARRSIESPPIFASETSRSLPSGEKDSRLRVSSVSNSRSTEPPAARKRTAPALLSENARPSGLRAKAEYMPSGMPSRVFSLTVIAGGTGIDSRKAAHASATGTSYTWRKRVCRKLVKGLNPPPRFQSSAYFSIPYVSCSQAEKAPPYRYDAVEPGWISREPATSFQDGVFPSILSWI